MDFIGTENPEGALIFDLDGTLVDTAGDIVFTVNHIRMKIGLAPLGTDKVLEAVGLGLPNLFTRLIEINENDREKFEGLRNEFRRHYYEHQTERSEVYPGMREALKSFGRRCDLHVLSNKPHVAVLRELEGHKIQSLFKSIYGAGALSAMKPDPVGIDTAVELSGVPRSSVVMIGDMNTDVMTAWKAGVKSCFVTWGFGTLKKGSPKPTVTVDKVEELEPAIERLLLMSRSSN
ncbi:MAG: HAD hydrolase-like protein [Proteobacteria bacterium]|nr:HAD hydrolase-like protein [Pseudomonadota bacterium]